jgi:hypothetical protein
MSRESDLLLGKLAIERGWITYDQLTQCMRAQEREVLDGDPEKTAGRGGGRPLGVIMTAMGLLTEPQLLDLYEEQRTRIEALRSYRLIEKSEHMLGQILVSRHLCTQNQINKCLEIQRKRAEQGVSPVPRLGEVLVEHGFVTAEKVQELLKEQNKTVMYCAGCKATYNVVGVKDGKQYKCRRCGEVLLSVDKLSTLRVDETAMEE